MQIMLNKENRIKTLQTILSLDESNIWMTPSNKYVHLIEDNKYCYCTIGHVLNKNFNLVTNEDFERLCQYEIVDMLDLDNNELIEFINRNDFIGIKAVKEYAKELLDSTI